jgi:hypothetical protein
MSSFLYYFDGIVYKNRRKNIKIKIIIVKERWGKGGKLLIVGKNRRRKFLEP